MENEGGGKVFRMAGNGEGFVSTDRGLESKTSTILSPHLPSFLLVGRIGCLAVIGSFTTHSVQLDNSKLNIFRFIPIDGSTRL